MAQSQEVIEAELNGTAPADSASVKRPYINVLMSEALRESVIRWAKANGTNASELGRSLFAGAVGYNLAGDPPMRRRARYSNDVDREAAKKLTQRKSALLRRALVQTYMAQRKGRQALASTASVVVNELSVGVTDDRLGELETMLSEAMRG